MILSHVEDSATLDCYSESIKTLADLKFSQCKKTIEVNVYCGGLSRN